MKPNHGTSTAIGAAAVVGAILVGAALFGILSFYSLSSTVSNTGGSSPASRQAKTTTATSTGRTNSSIVTVTPTGCGPSNESVKFVNETFPAPTSSQPASPPVVHLNATPVGDTKLGFPLNGMQQRKVFSADGLTWIFYSDGKYMLYQTSRDGNIWSNQVNVTAQPKGFHFSIWYDLDSNTVHYVNTDGFGCGFWYRWGNPDSNGRITWGIKESFVPTGPLGTNPYIYAKGNDVWVSLQTSSGADIEVWKFNDSSWARKLVIPTMLGSVSILLPLSSGIALVYGVGNYRPSYQNVTTSVDDGKTWSAPVSTPDQYITQSAVSVADTVYFVGVDKSLHLRFVSYTLGDTSFHNDGTVATGIYRGVISTNGASELAVVYADNSSIYYRSLSLPVGNWSSERLLLTSPSPLPMHPPQSSPYLNCDPLMIPYLSLNNRLPVVWLFGNNPFVLMFSVASLPT